MSHIPFIPKIQPDELLYSYILRTAHLNGVEDIKVFMDFYVYPKNKNSKKKYINVGYDVRNDLYTFMRSLGIHDTLNTLDFYLKTSLFEGISPLMSRDLSSHHIGMLAKHESFSGILPSPNSIIQKLRICHECQKEEQRTLRCFYYHRSHQMPGVTVCYKHGCTLMEYTGKKGKELIDKKSFIELPLYKNSLEYATFCHDFLHLGIQASLFDIKQAIKNKLKELGYTQNKIETMRLDMSELNTLMSEDIAHFMTITLFSGTYVNMQTCLTILMFLFKSADAIKSSIKIRSTKEEFLSSITGRYELISTWREDLIELKCLICGCLFLTTPYRIISGWSCPDCDRLLPENTLFQHLFDVKGNGNYELLSEFKGNSQKIKIRHKLCDKIYSVRARAFLEENSKCSCEYIITESQARKAIESLGDFQVVSFKSTTDIVKIKHHGCGETFDWNYHKFLRQPWCKLCFPHIRTESIFKQEIYNLTGTDYTLVSKYIDKDTKVILRHNTCGCNQKYTPHQFLDGGRCKKCRPFIKSADFARLVSNISCGRYQYTGHKSKNLEIIKDTVTGDEKILSINKTLQELCRFTPSTILPLDKRNLNIEYPVYQDILIYQWILKHYSIGDLLFMEDIQIEGFEYSDIKHGMNSLVQKKKLNRIELGIFAFPRDMHSSYEVMYNKYIKRNGHRIGYLTDYSFAYELGLRKNKAERIGIITNKEAMQHGRNRTFMNIELKLHGSKIVINDDNYAILALLSFLTNEKRLKCCTVNNKREILKQWLRKQKIVLSDFDGYYQYFPSWLQKSVTDLYKEDLCQK